MSQLLRRGYHTHALSPKLHGALYSNALRSLDTALVSVAIAGGGWT